MAAAIPLSDVRLDFPGDGVRIELVGAEWEHEVAVNGAELHWTSLNRVPGRAGRLTPGPVA